jgi:predicted nucleotidyltransferase
MGGMTTRERNIDLPLAQIEAFCQRNPIRKLSLFGSVLRDDFSEKSDVDFLVELEPDAPVGLFKFIGMQDELEDMIGRKADLRTPLEFSEQNRRRILKEAEAIFIREE